MPPIALFALLYGDYNVLHSRLLHSLMTTRRPGVRYTFWCNDVCRETRAYLEALQKIHPDIRIIHSPNTPKSIVMRKLFDEGVAEPYTIWCDDDISFPRYDWLDIIRIMLKKGMRYGGVGWTYRVKAKAWEHVIRAPWFRNRLPPASDKMQFHFARGGFWIAETAAIKAIDWPDRRLRHNNDDSFLHEDVCYGIALYQVGVEFTELPGDLVDMPHVDRRGPKVIPTSPLERTV